MAYLFYKKDRAPVRYSKDGFKLLDEDRLQEDYKKRLALRYWEYYQQVCEMLGIDRII